MSGLVTMEGGRRPLGTLCVSVCVCVCDREREIMEE
jgi:hypothetical protein